MNKTININLANQFFHIDEDAYRKLQNYLEAIKRSFKNSEGSEEIISDIEARIAELFSEKQQDARQVITIKEVDEVITIMGQPEDYMIDEEIFEDEPKTSTSTSRGASKKLYRDGDNKFIGGVSAGLGHYLGVDPIWIRIIWVLLVVAGAGTPIFIYILLWILVPEATTTAEKIAMTGEPVNISNIEKKVKEGLDNVSEKVKSVDYDKVGDTIKKSSKSFFDVLGNIFAFLLKVFGKFIGIILIIIGASTIIGLIIALTSIGVAEAVHIPGLDIVEIVNSTTLPIWVISLIIFLLVGIPFFFLFYLGLKILVSNLNSIGNVAKYSLLGLWLLSIVAISILITKQVSEFAYTASAYEEKILPVSENDTLFLSLASNENYQHARSYDDFHGMKLIYDDNGDELLYSRDINVNIKVSKTGNNYLKIRKDADGSSFAKAKNTADLIDYQYILTDNQLTLNDYLTTASENKYRNQDVNPIIYVTPGTILSLDKSMKRQLRYSIANNKDYSRNSFVKHTWIMNEQGILECLDCPEENEENEEEAFINIETSENSHIIIDKNGIDIDVKNDSIETFKMKNDENGVKIKSNKNQL